MAWQKRGAVFGQVFLVYRWFFHYNIKYVTAKGCGEAACAA